MFYSWLSGPLVQNSYHLVPTLLALHRNLVARSPSSRRVSLIWGAESWKGSRQGSTLMGRRKPLKFPEWMTCLSCHAVCLLTVKSDRLRSTVWKVASADSSKLKVVVPKREHSVPSATVSPLTGARCYSLTPPCVKANSEALFKKQLLRRCTISWNDPLTFLSLLISKQWIIRRTRADCTAHFFQSKKPAPQILVCPKRDSLIKQVCSKTRGAGSVAPSNCLMESRRRTAHSSRWTGQCWSKGVSQLCFTWSSNHTSAAPRASSAQTGPEPKILFDWITCCCLFNNLLLQGGSTAVRKLLHGWKEQSNWGNWGNHNPSFAIFTAVQRDYLVMSTYRGSNDEASALPSPLSKQCLHPALGYSTGLISLLYITDYTHLIKSDFFKKKPTLKRSDKQIVCFEQPRFGLACFHSTHEMTLHVWLKVLLLLCVCAKGVSSPHHFWTPLPNK